MSVLEGLLAACREAPDDDAPRLVWADAVGGERGELVVVQCDLARGGHDTPRAQLLRRREGELLAANGAAWSGLEGIATRCVFRRGFVEAAVIEGASAGALAGLFGRARLLSSLTVTGLTLEALDVLLAEPELDQLGGLTVQEQMRGGALDHRLIARLAATSARLAGLRTLGFYAEIGDRGLDALLRSDLLTRLERLVLHWVPLTEDRAAELCRQAPVLRALDVSTPADAFTAGLAPSIVELTLPIWTHRGLGDEEPLHVLATSPAAATLERLRISGYLGRTPQLFARFPRLRSLDLGDCSAGRARDPASWVATPLAFAAVRIPALRELASPMNLDAEATRILAETYRGQLEVLDTAGGTERWSSELPGAGVQLHEPWLQRGFVKLRAW